MSTTIENPRPNQVAKWVLFVASAAPILIGVADVLNVTGPGDQKMSAGMGLVFFFIPASFLFALILAVLTCARWRGSTVGDKLLGLIPLSFPIVAILAVSYL
jgi:hypothetical protein